VRLLTGAAQKLEGGETDPLEKCKSSSGINANKCARCCQAAYLKASREVAQLEAVLDVIQDGESELVQDLQNLLGLTYARDAREIAAETIINDAGFDLQLSGGTLAAGPTIGGGRLAPVTRVRTSARPNVRPSGLPRLPEMVSGQAVVFVTPGWSANPTAVLQQLTVAVGNRISTRRQTGDCCACVLKSVWSQRTPRKRVKTDSGTIRRREPGGSKP